MKPLKYGYFKLKNCSRNESDEGASLQEDRARKRALLKTSEYAARKNVLGVKALTLTLTNFLVWHIDFALSALQKSVKFFLEGFEEELYALEEAPPENARSFRIVLSEITRK